MLCKTQASRLQRAARLQIENRFDEAAEIYEQLHASAPGDFQVNHLLGVLRQQQGRPAEAVPLLSRARRSAPLSASTVMCLGLALDALGRHGEAGRMLRMSVALDPKSAEGFVNLGSHYGKQGRTEEAVAQYRRALGLRPDYPQAWTGLGTVLHLAGRSGEAESCHSRALQLDPKDRQAHFGRGQARQALNRTDEALADFDAHLALRPEHHEARSFRLFLLNYRDDLSREAVFAEHKAYGRSVEESLRGRPAAPPFLQSPDPSRRIRLAFLSPDMRGHSVSYFLEPLLQRIDRGSFEVILYHDHFSVDAVSERLRAGADLWRKTSGQADNVVEETIRADRPDVLVDLAGHTGFNRLELLARRLAPVQVSYLGYPNTTGLSAMDFRLTDSIADPPGEADGLCVERLVRFAPTAWAYLPPPTAPAPGRVTEGRPGVTFGSFNVLSKAGAGTLRLWRNVLEAVPGSRLLIKSSGMDPVYWRGRLAGAGLPVDRVELIPMTPGVPEHLACYGRMDIALDCFPYQGTTTTCEALWMGVPVVTLAGDRHASRVGASLLTAVGHPEWIASTPEDYSGIASRLAADPARLRALRIGLRDDMRRSALLDYGAQAERFGAAVRSCWAGWCAARESAALAPELAAAESP
jgi:predicted O-linked N-acetylglucosamine transferase (SPINDLY family)